MSKPRHKLSKNLRRTAQRASRNAGFRIHPGACQLADELTRVYAKTEPDPSAVQPEPIRTQKQHRVSGSNRSNRIAACRRRKAVISGLSAFLFVLLFGLILAAFIRCIYLILFP